MTRNDRIESDIGAYMPNQANPWNSPWLKREGQNIADLGLLACFALWVVHKDCDSTHIDEAKPLGGQGSAMAV